MAALDFHGRPVEGPLLRVGVIGCGSHAGRNIYPALSVVPVELVATCDLDASRAAAFAAKFGASSSYADHHEMLERADIDAVVLVTSLDPRGRPRYPDLAIDCLEAGCHVWMEKPPAASCADIARVQAAAGDRTVMVGLKKMFAPANRKAYALSRSEDFGRVTLARAEYPQHIPTVEQFASYRHGACDHVAWFLDHLCHPASALQLLMGPPSTLLYRRAANGAGVALLEYADGAVASLSLTHGGAYIDGLERTVLTSDAGRHIVVDNNLRVEYHRMPVPGYGDVADFYTADPDQATAVWQPEFSLGQLYNKGLFLLGYYGEMREFVTAALEGRAPSHAGLDDAWHVTRLFEGFFEGPDVTVTL